MPIHAPTSHIMASTTPNTQAFNTYKLNKPQLLSPKWGRFPSTQVYKMLRGRGRCNQESLKKISMHMETPADLRMPGSRALARHWSAGFALKEVGPDLGLGSRRTSRCRCRTQDLRASGHLLPLSSRSPALQDRDGPLHPSESAVGAEDQNAFQPELT